MFAADNTTTVLHVGNGVTTVEVNSSAGTQIVDIHSPSALYSRQENNLMTNERLIAWMKENYLEQAFLDGWGDRPIEDYLDEYCYKEDIAQCVYNDLSSLLKLRGRNRAAAKE